MKEWLLFLFLGNNERVALLKDIGKNPRSHGEYSIGDCLVCGVGGHVLYGVCDVCDSTFVAGREHWERVVAQD